jgi:hypothetical protein
MSTGTVSTQTQTAIAPVTGEAAERASLFHRVWPIALVILGFVINVAWIGLLGYSLIMLVRATL